MIILAIISAAALSILIGALAISAARTKLAEIVADAMNPLEGSKEESKK